MASPSVAAGGTGDIDTGLISSRGLLLLDFTGEPLLDDEVISVTSLSVQTESAAAAALLAFSISYRKPSEEIE